MANSYLIILVPIHTLVRALVCVRDYSGILRQVVMTATDPGYAAPLVGFYIQLGFEKMKVVNFANDAKLSLVVERGQKGTVPADHFAGYLVSLIYGCSVCVAVCVLLLQCVLQCVCYSCSVAVCLTLYSYRPLCRVFCFVDSAVEVRVLQCVCYCCSVCCCVCATVAVL